MALVGLSTVRSEPSDRTGTIHGNGPDRTGTLVNFCFIHKRAGDPPLICGNHPQGLVSLVLSGYAVVPLEVFAYGNPEVENALRDFALSYVNREVP